LMRTPLPARPFSSAVFNSAISGVFLPASSK
jgi:hypothetical protein